MTISAQLRACSGVLWLVLSSLLICISPAGASQLSIQEYGEDAGLGNLAVQALAQDADGYLWAGTQNGVYRFDGARLRRFGTDQHIVDASALVMDGSTLWIAASEGLWARRGGHLQPVRPDGAPLRLSELPQIIAPSAHHVWVTSNWQLIELIEMPDGRWHQRDAFSAQVRAQHKELSSVTSVIRGQRGDVWFGCSVAICHLDGGHLDIWRGERGVPKSVWHWLLIARDGSLWARGNRHVIQLEPGHQRFTDRTDVHAEQDPDGLYPLAEDAERHIIGADRTGVVLWDGRRWSHSNDGLPSGGRLQALLVDREGGLWFGQMGGGLLQWRGYGQWENWTVADGLPHSVVWGVQGSSRPGGPRLVATGAGLAAFDPAMQRFRLLTATAKQEMVAVARDETGAIWAGTRRGRLFRILAEDTDGNTEQFDLPNHAPIAHMFRRRAGGIWIQTWDGVSYLDTHDRPYLPLHDIAATQDTLGEIHAACEDDSGKLWLAGERGIASREAAGWRLWPGMATDVVLMSCLGGGVLATSNGSNGIKLWKREGTQFNARDVTPPFLNDRLILSLMLDHRGWLWAGSDAGVAVWNQRNWRHLDQSRGLLWNDVSANAMYEDDDGSVWIGTSRGVSHMIAPDQIFAPTPVRVDIDAVKRGAAQLPVSQAEHIAWSSEPIDIYLAVPVYQNRSALKVAYRLPGLDPTWRDLSHMDVHLTGLPAGDYRFEARVTDTELGTTSDVSGMDIILAPPWWRTRSATFAALCLVGMLLYGWYRWRILAHLHYRKKLEALVAVRTRELEASRDSLRDLATKDPLTGVWNRRALDEILEREIDRSQRERHPLAIAIADIDHFKRVNDTWGHQAGDAVLVEFAARILGNLRTYDALGRYGGEEFVLVMPGLDVGDPVHAQRLATIHSAISAAPMKIGMVTCSIGVAGSSTTFPLDAKTLIARADEALYMAKRNGRNRIEWADEISTPD